MKWNFCVTTHITTDHFRFCYYGHFAHVLCPITRGDLRRKKKNNFGCVAESQKSTGHSLFFSGRHVPSYSGFPSPLHTRPTHFKTGTRLVGEQLHWTYPTRCFGNQTHWWWVWVSSDMHPLIQDLRPSTLTIALATPKSGWKIDVYKTGPSQAMAIADPPRAASFPALTISNSSRSKTSIPCHLPRSRRRLVHPASLTVPCGRLNLCTVYMVRGIELN